MISTAKTTEHLWKCAPAMVLCALIIFFSLVNSNFLSLVNFARMSISTTPAMLVALGVTFIIIMGSIDLSMEGTIATTAVVFGLLFMGLGGRLSSGSAWISLPAAAMVGAALGWINGQVHVKLRIPSFMSSLAMGFVGTGVAILLTNGDRIVIEDETFRSLLITRVLGFPLMAYVGLAFVLIAWFIQRKTTIGRNFYAVGGGEALAHSSGLNVKRVRIMGYTIAGVFYAVAAVLAVARLGMAEATTGSNYMFMSITAVVVGGTSLLGGVGGVWNTVVGVLIVNVISNGMIVIGLPRYLQDGVLGVLVIIAVILSTDRKNIFFVK